MRSVKHLWPVAVCVATLSCSPDSGFEPDAYSQWLRFEDTAAVCANGSTYEYFAWFSETSDNLVISLEAGGACWDYESCTQDPPFNTECVNDPGSDCIRDDYATAYRYFDIPDDLADIAEIFGIIDGNVPIDFTYPTLSTDPYANPTADWNKVFLPYCTGDTHSGDTVRTYSDPAGVQPDIEFHHRGFHNVSVVLTDLNRMFPKIPKMLVSGCSAGGLGSMANYTQVRAGLNVDQGYMLADGSPVVPSQLLSGADAHSRMLHDTVTPVWGLAQLIATIPGAEPTTRVGEINGLVAQAHPDDRLSVTTFIRDYQFPLRGYVPFLPFFETNPPETPAARTEVYRLWSEEMAALRTQFDPHPNLAYYLPYYRTTNNSHCLTVAGFEDYPTLEEFAVAALGDPATALWKGTEIEASGYSLKTYLEHLLDDDVALDSTFESECEGRFQVCALDCPSYDATLCAAEVSAANQQ